MFMYIHMCFVNTWPHCVIIFINCVVVNFNTYICFSALLDRVSLANFWNAKMIRTFKLSLWLNYSTVRNQSWTKLNWKLFFCLTALFEKPGVELSSLTESLESLAKFAGFQESRNVRNDGPEILKHVNTALCVLCGAGNVNPRHTYIVHIYVHI
jgi:hypothetical protein